MGETVAGRALQGSMMTEDYDFTRTVARHPWRFGAANALVFSVLLIAIVFQSGTPVSRVALGATIGIIWGILQFALASYWKSRLGPGSAEHSGDHVEQ
jgi:hypothetical protein